MSPVDRFAICPATNMEVASIKILEWPEGRSLHRPAGGDTRRAARQDGRALGRCPRRWRFEGTISGLPHRSRLLLPQERQAHLLEGFCQLISAMVCLKRFCKRPAKSMLWTWLPSGFLREGHRWESIIRRITGRRGLVSSGSLS